MRERITSSDFWLSVRNETRVSGEIGRYRCMFWCEDVLKIEKIAQTFTEKVANLGEIQIDQYATSTLVHHWLEKDGFIADGTAGQFDPEYPGGYYGFFEDASDILQKIYAKGEDKQI